MLLGIIDRPKATASHLKKLHETLERPWWHLAFLMIIIQTFIFHVKKKFVSVYSTC